MNSSDETVTDPFRVPPVFVRGVGDSQRVQAVAFEERLRGVTNLSWAIPPGAESR